MLIFHALNCYLIVAIGTIFPIEVRGVVFPIHTAYIVFYFALLFRVTANVAALFRGLLVISPFALAMFFSLTEAHDLPYALKKIEGGIIASILIAIIVAHCVRNYGLNNFLDSYLKITLIMLAATIVYLFASGYEIGSRPERFLINGPITYGWLMGIAAIIGLYLYRQAFERKYLFYFIVFLAMMVATESKGPLVAFLVSGAVFFIYNACSKRVLFLATLSALGAFLATQFVSVEALGRFAALQRLLTGQLEEQDSGSISVRMIAWGESLTIFKSHTFFGVGLGNWEDYSGINILYPHNFFLEIASEMGLLGVAAFAVVIAVLLLNRIFFVVLYLLFFLIALSFSGDMSYHRYLLGIPLGLLLGQRNRVYRR